MPTLPKSIIARSSRIAIDELTESSYFGPHLAMSSAGHECDRAVWLGLHWASKEEIPAKLKRIFERGNIEEPRIVRDLESIGCKVTEQQAVVYGFEKYPKGKIDGIVEKLPESPHKHLLEIKTMNDKNFNKLKAIGVKKGFNSYYIQAQLYMGYKKLKRCLFAATNKNDEEREHQHIRYDDRVFRYQEERLRTIILTGAMPASPGQCSPKYYKCRYCKHGEICYADKPPEVTCRSCCWSNKIGEAKWECGHDRHWKVLTDKKIDLGYTNTISNERQRIACKLYQRLF
ncbi:MAG: YqaJ viral recombinase family protein [Planctomycetes bacterium]|nr:YqaJ viral recombinase family protein [Planctomycetota bacterium]